MMFSLIKKTIVHKILIVLCLLLVSAIGLMFVIRGEVEDDAVLYQSGYDTKVGSPFESSNSTSRYVLTEAIVDDKSFALTDDKARAASPDLAKYKDTYLSIFTPGVSFLGIPFYMLGKLVGLPQLSTYLLTSIIACLNVILVAKVSRLLGADRLSAILSGFIFLFATNALSYSQTFTQHHYTAFLLLIEVIISTYARRASTDLIAGVAFGYGILVDIPNVFMLFPAFMHIVWKHVHISLIDRKTKINLYLISIFILLGVIPSIGLYGYYNRALTGSPTKLGQFIGRYDYPNPNDTRASEQLKKEQESTYEGPKPLRLMRVPLDTREQLRSLHILLLSKQRSWIFYSPIVLLGIIGLVLSYKNPKTRALTVVILSSIITNIVLYASFDDPWGGWSFGPRYLIPSAALLCAAVGPVLMWSLKNYIRLFVITIAFFALLALSVQASLLGVLTTAAIPSRGEAEALKNDTPWTTEYNKRMLIRDKRTTSLIYNLKLQDQLKPEQYYNALVIGWLLGFGILYFAWLANGYLITRVGGEK